MTSTVYLSQTPYLSTSTGRVAGVFLSQLPYTGILADYGSLILFLIGLLFWGALVALVIHKEWHLKFMRLIKAVETMPLAHFETSGALASMQSGNPYHSIIAEPHLRTTPDTAVSAQVPPAASHDALVDTAYAEYSGIEKNDAYLAETFGRSTAEAKQEAPGVFIPESKAKTWMKSEPIRHTLQTLLLREAQKSKVIISDDGFSLIMNAGNHKEEESRQILSQLIMVADTSYPRVDGWLTLGEREIRTILFSTYMSMTAVFIGWLSRGEKASAFAFIRTLKQQGHSLEVFITEVITLIDGIYRFRIEGDTGAYDQYADEMLKGISNEKIQEIVGGLVLALDHGYRSADTAAKMALIRIFSVGAPKTSISNPIATQLGKNEHSVPFRTPTEYIR